MSDDHRGWFHCGRCGHLFQAALGDGPRVCGNCGHDPSVFGDSLAKLKQSPGPASIPAPRQSQAGEELTVRKRPVRKRRGNLLVVKICAAWLVMLGGIVFIAWWLGGKEPEQTNRPGITQAGGDTTESVLIKDAMPKISRNFGGFLNSTDPAERNQFVARSETTGGKLARFYAMNPLGQVKPTDVALDETRVLQLPSGQAIATSWKVADGRKLDAVFFPEEDDWRLDWQQFARYSDYPWALFLSGTEDQSGEFRLLVRERLASEKAGDKEMSVVFYAPRFGQPDQPGYASPEFRVDRSSENGRLLGAAFLAAQANKRPYDGIVSKADPEGMVRVRVVIHRTQDASGRHFQLEKVIACHWISVDEPGLEPLTEAQVQERQKAALGNK